MNEQVPPDDAPVEGEITALPVAIPPEPFQGSSNLVLRPEEADILQERPADDDHDILPTGEVYVTQVRYRRILNRAFGPGQWCLVPLSPWAREANTVCREFALRVRGCFVASSIGEADYQPANDRMTYATACEAAKSNALTRCCKDLGIASECWDRHWTDSFKERCCIQVWVEGRKQPQWRRRDAKPFYKETGVLNNVPPPAMPPPKSDDVLRAEETIAWLAKEGLDHHFNDALDKLQKKPVVLNAVRKQLWDAAKARGFAWKDGQFVATGASDYAETARQAEEVL